MDVESALHICHTCLSRDRQLYPLTMFPSLIQLNFLLVNQTPTVCWECKNKILKFCDFITKAVSAQKMLMDAQHNSNIVCLSALGISKQQPLFEFTHIDDPLTNVEIQCIKQENFSSDAEFDTYEDDTQQIENTEDIKYNSESFLMNYQNGDVNATTSDFKMDIKIEYDPDEVSVTKHEKCEASETKTIIFEDEAMKNRIKVGTDEDKRRDMRIVTLSEIRNKLLDLPEEVMKKILIVELTDEEVQKQRDQKRSHHNFTKLPYKCNYCIVGFTKEENFIEHVKKKHEHNSNIKGDFHCCDICHLRFKTLLLARKHRERHFIQYKCRLCNYEVCYLWAIVAHIKEKHNETVGQIPSHQDSAVSAEIKIMKTYAQRQKEYRMRKKIEKERLNPKRIPKTNAQRQQEYREKLKKIQQSEPFNSNLARERKEEKKERNREYQRAWRQRQKDLKKKVSKEEKEERKRKRHRENQRAYYQRTKSLKKNDKNVEELFQKKLDDLQIKRKIDANRAKKYRDKLKSKKQHSETGSLQPSTEDSLST